MNRILFVDDDVEIINFAKQLLSDCYQIHTALNPHESIKLCKTYRYDLIVIDLNLPEINGFQLINKIGTTWQNQSTSFMISSSNKEKKNILRAGKLGAASYIIKPLSPTILKEKINTFFIQKNKHSIPKHDFPYSITFSANVSTQLEVESINEFGVTVRTSSKLPLDSSIEVQSSDFEKFGTSTISTVVSKERPLPDQEWEYTLHFSEPRLDLINKIRAYQSLKQFL